MTPLTLRDPRTGTQALKRYAVVDDQRIGTCLLPSRLSYSLTAADRTRDGVNRPVPLRRPGHTTCPTALWASCWRWPLWVMRPVAPT